MAEKTVTKGTTEALRNMVWLDWQDREGHEFYSCQLDARLDSALAAAGHVA